MAALDMDSFDKALKVRYTDGAIRNMVYKEHPFLAMVPKMTTFTGKSLEIPIIGGLPTGRAATFSVAQTNKAPGIYKSFNITRVSDYGLASIDGETILASQGDPGAFLRAAVVEVDGILQQVSNSLARGLYGNGSGSLGAIGSQSTVTLTLANPEDVVNFEVGMVIVSAANAASALNDSGEARTITAVDRDAGTLTCAAADSGWDGVSGAGTADLLFQQGDYVTTSDRLKVSGLAAWLPAAAPADTFFGVVRTSDPVRYGGIRYSGSAETIEEALIGAGARAFRHGARVDTCLMNPTNVGALQKSLGSKVVFDVAKSSDGKIGFESIVVMTPAGRVKVVADPDCPVNVCYLLRLDSWKLYSLGEAPMILRHGDDLKFLRDGTADAVEIRTGYYAQLGCNAPGWNVRIALA